MKEFVVSRHVAGSTDDASPRSAHFRADDRGVLTWADSGAESLFGYSSGRFPGMTVRQLVAGSEDDPFSPAHEEVLNHGQKLTLTFRHANGVFFTGHLQLGASHLDEDNAASAMITLLPEASLERSRLRQIEIGAKLGTWDLGVQNNNIHWSEGVYNILELRPGAEVSPEHALFYFQAGQTRIRAALRRCLRTGKAFAFDLPILTAQQRPRWVRLTGNAEYQGELVDKVSGVLVDITPEHDQTLKAQRWRHLLDGMLASTDELIMAVDPEFKVILINEAAASQFETTFNLRPAAGDALPELLQQYPNENRLYRRLWQRAMERDFFCVEMPLSQQDPDLAVFEVHFHRLTDGAGNVIGAVFRAQDMSEKVGQGTLSYVTSHDPVTGLLNRRELLHRLKRALLNKAEKGNAHALLYLDLDHFEKLNDTFGTAACDRYLRALAMRLSSRIRQRDALARVGGDKLAVLLDNCNENEARKVAENLRVALGELTLEWRNQSLSCTASAGLVPLPSQIDERPEDLLALAADLCQTAKAAGRNRLHVHRDPGNLAAEEQTSVRLQQLQTAMTNKAVELRFQAIRPIASVTWGDNVEILSRLKVSSEATSWGPGEFLPLAERFDLASQFDRLVVAETLAWLARNPLMEPRLKMCCFNVSQGSLMDSTFASEIGPLLAESKYAPSVFCFEVQESDAVRDPSAVEALCHALHELGCRVALEGVSGTGQSYNLISRLPIDVIKLDGKLMKSMMDEPVQQVMVESLHRVAEVSGKITIAQYIEDDEMLKQARALGIHFGQGYRLASPRPLDELAPPPWQNVVN